MSDFNYLNAQLTIAQKKRLLPRKYSRNTICSQLCSKKRSFSDGSVKTNSKLCQSTELSGDITADEWLARQMDEWWKYVSIAQYLPAWCVPIDIENIYVLICNFLHLIIFFVLLKMVHSLYEEFLFLCFFEQKILKVLKSL